MRGDRCRTQRHCPLHLTLFRVDHSCRGRASPVQLFQARIGGVRTFGRTHGGQVVVCPRGAGAGPAPGRIRSNGDQMRGRCGQKSGERGFHIDRRAQAAGCARALTLAPYSSLVICCSLKQTRKSRRQPRKNQSLTSSTQQRSWARSVRLPRSNQSSLFFSEHRQHSNEGAIFFYAQYAHEF